MKNIGHHTKNKRITYEGLKFFYSRRGDMHDTTKTKPHNTENASHVYQNIHPESNFAPQSNSMPNSNLMKENGK